LIGAFLIMQLVGEFLEFKLEQLEDDESEDEDDAV